LPILGETRRTRAWDVRVDTRRRARAARDLLRATRAERLDRAVLPVVELHRRVQLVVDPVRDLDRLTILQGDGRGTRGNTNSSASHGFLLRRLNNTCGVGVVPRHRTLSTP